MDFEPDASNYKSAMRDLPETQYSLLVQLGRNQEEAWATFVGIYQTAIHDFCRRKGLQDADAADVTQEVLTAVGKRVKTWDSDPTKGSFRGWLYRVTRNMAINCLVARQKKVSGSGDSRVMELLKQTQSVDPQESDAFLDHYRRAMFRWAAGIVKPLVKPSAWKAFHRTAIDNQTPQQVADELQMSIGAVYTAKCRVFAKIKEVIAEVGDEFEMPETEQKSTEPEHE